MAIAFDGGSTADDLITFGVDDTLLTENGAMSFFGWIYFRTAGEASLGRFWSRQSGGNVNMLHTGGAIRFQVNGSTALLRECTQTTYLPASTWVPVVITWDGSTTASNIHMYFSGSEASYTTTTNGVTPTDNSAAAIVIGNTADGTRCGDFIGQSFAFWDSVISTADIAFLSNSKLMYAPLLCSVKPKRFWPMDEFGDGVGASGASSIIDRSGNADHGTPTGSPTASASTILSYHDQGILFVGNDGGAAAPSGKHRMFQVF